MRWRWAAVLAAAAVPFAAEAADKIKVTVPGENANFAQYFIADQRGYFKDEGVDVELSILSGGPATPALIAGSIQYSGSSSSAMTATLKGADLKVVLVGQDRPIYEFWSFDPEVKTFEQLKGKLILVTSRGGSDDIALRMYLKAKGLPTDYFGVTAIGGGAPVRVAAVMAGSQKFVSLTRTERDELGNAGMLAKGTMIFSPAKEVELTLGGLATTGDEVRKNRDQVKRILRAIWKGTIVMMTDKAGTIAEMKKRLPRLAHEVIVRDVEGGIEDVNPKGLISRENQVKELAVRAELLKVPPDKIPPVEKIYDFSIIQEVIAELKKENWRPAP
jgi:ABC-type nitrate/sulfonate/bicarbonate transport system substrate-binding protein